MPSKPSHWRDSEHSNHNQRTYSLHSLVQLKVHVNPIPRSASCGTMGNVHVTHLHAATSISAPIVPKVGLTSRTRQPTVQGGATPIGPVLTTATAVKMWSRGHGTSEAPVKRSSSKLVPTTVKINPHLLFCIKLQSVTRPDPDLAIRSTEEHNCHDICLHAQQLSYLALATVMGGAYGTMLMRFMTFVSFSRGFSSLVSVQTAFYLAF